MPTVTNREIPYNYNSCTDQDIVIRLLDNKAWDIISELRLQRKIGYSARMLFEVLGDLWVVYRNPYIQDDLISNRRRRHALQQALLHRLDMIASRADTNTKVLTLLTIARSAVEKFNLHLIEQNKMRRKAYKTLGKVLRKDNICFDGLSRVAHATDATDWRVEYPFVVLKPDSETQIAPLVKACITLGLTIIPRGGGTGYTGGAIPLTPHSAVINLEKLEQLSAIEPMTLPGTDIVMATVNAECGVVTRRLGDLAKTQDLVFAVDPTSQDASTIGGNVAMNAGGGKAVLWGTTLDNLVSWRMVTPRGTWQEIVRQNHNVSKIHLQDNTTFSITEYAADGKTPLADPTLLTIPGASLRKEGLGKDVTDKFLSGLPGVQKEGCDGLITSARFILHKPPQHIRTVCMEFFGDNLQKAVPAIVEIKNYLDALPEVLLSGLEHLDERYIKAVKYTTKVTRAERPKMILLADIVSDNENALNAAAAEMVRLTNLRNGEGFTASSSAARAIFWLDRTRTAAIATHTNAFKINEDVVIPLPRLGEYNNSIERINIEYSLGNKLAMLATQLTFLQALADKHSEQPLLLEKINAAYSIVIQTQKQWQIIANDLDTYFIELQSRTLRISYKTTISKPLLTIFAGEEHSGIRDSLN